MDFRAVPRETRSDARIDSSHHRLRVSIRVRPALSRETSSNGSFHSCIGCHDGNVYLTTDDNPVLVGADGTVTSGSAEHHVFDSAFDSDTTVADAPETHQWLDFTCRPSNRSYVCDLFVDDGAHDLPAFVRLRRYRVTGGEAPPREEELAIAPHLTEPLIQAYTTSLYPHGKLPRLCGRDTTTAAFTG